MNHGYVTLDEVFEAAAARSASLVPETSGYLALALGDATARRPLAHDDRAVMLTDEGNLSLIRRGDEVSPRQAAREIRDMLARLLAVSAGTMPGLAGAARPREESDRGVEAVVEEIEAALIPVNRAAARRALARLARETLRAKELGEIGELSQPPVQAQGTPSQDPSVVLAASDASPRPPAEPTPTVIGMAPVSSCDPPQAEAIDLEPPTEVDTITVAVASPTPSRTIPLPPERLAPRAIPVSKASFRTEPVTRADVLLSEFGVSCGNDAGMRAAAASLKKFAGIEPTPPPPVPAPRRPPSAPRSSRAFSSPHEECSLDELLETPSPRRVARARRTSALGVTLALLLGAIAGTFVVAHARPDLLSSIAARITARAGELR